jgi:hypothetical protein
MRILIRVFGLIAFSLGVVLLLFGINSSQVFFERFLEKLTGRYSEETMWYLIGGITSIIVGAALAIFGGVFKKNIESR